MLWFLEREVESHSEARNLSALNIKSGTESSGTDFRDWIFLEGSKNTTGGDLHFTIWNICGNIPTECIGIEVKGISATIFTKFTIKDPIFASCGGSRDLNMSHISESH